MVNNKKAFRLLIFAVAFSACRSALPAFDEKEIIGLWVSEEDKNYTMRFSSGSVVMVYEGDADSVYYFEISGTTCDTAYYRSGEDNVRFLRIHNESEEFCYEITALNSKNLALMYSHNGNILVFKKK